MKNISVVVLSPDSDSKEMLNASCKSVKMAGIEASTSPEEKSVKMAIEKEFEFCHFVKAGTVLMPDFYKAAINMIGKFDYAFCHCLSLPQGEKKIHPIPDDFIITQIIIKTWVVKELAVNDVNDLMKRVLTEYRGIEVPHIMVVEV